jgi:membrane-bound serine protease (ClpP class)
VRQRRPVPASRTRLALLGAWVALCAALLVGACGNAEPRSALHIGHAEGMVNNVMERYVDRVITDAEDARAVAVVLRVDTPGGAISSMKAIAGRIERSNVPVITWVGPPGAEAASAGTFITMAGHIAAMAPNTTIGAATPVGPGGEDVEGAIGRKVTEDTVAFARGLAEHRDRNADWAERAVRDAVSAPPSEAVELNVVDLMASSIEALLEEIEGREVTLLDGRQPTLTGLAVAPRVDNPPNRYERVLAIISDPVIVSILLLLGLAGIAIEFFAPGLFVPGALGLIALLLAFLGAGTLLPGEAAVALFILGAVLIAAEFFVPSGLLGLVGGLAILLALAIWAGQVTTDVGILRVLLAFLLVVLVISIPIGLWLRKYLGGSSQTGTRLT